jgi:hypothetical protein
LCPAGSVTWHTPNVTVHHMQPIPALKPLLMEAEPLAKLMANRDRWIKLAARLKHAFPALPKTDPNANDVIHLCGAYYAHNQAPLISSYAYHYEKKVDKATFEALAMDTVGFLKEFMDARGQWAYIESQRWYQRREYVIGIDVNYYPDRSGSAYTMSPLFHKDTGGNNLFVNLIFDNRQPIESTEWFIDVQEPSNKRAVWQRSLLPPAHLDELAALRQELRDSGEYRVPAVKGGVIRGDNVYVSWVDDLVWHATPSLNERIEYSAAAAIAAYPDLKESIRTGQTFPFTTAKGRVRIHPVELLGSIADDSHTNLSQWLRDRGAQVQDLDFELARIAWFLLYGNTGGQARFTSDARQRGASEWRLVGQVADAIAPEDRLSQGVSRAPHITETPAGLSMVRRANSVDTIELKEVAAQNQGLPRSFVRTWVRILSKDAQELKRVNFVFK